MENKLYQELCDLEERHWWFVGRRRIIFDLINREIPEVLSRALDIGCGTGFNAELLRSRAKEVWGLEASGEMAEEAGKRAPGVVVVEGVFPEARIGLQFNLITLFDVLEHLEDDRAALEKIHSLLEPGGYAVFTVPAFSFLWSEHDDLAHHKRRYAMPELNRLLDAAGFSIQRLTYFNTFLFAPIWLLRRARRIAEFRRGSSDFFIAPSAINRILASFFGAERFFLRRMDFPFGVSLFAVARKK
jgi:SAM-dependent methyltransferase